MLDLGPAEDSFDELERKLVVPRGDRSVGREDAKLAGALDVSLVDVGAASTNFTVEMWLDADAQNTQSFSEGASYNLTNGNIALDSDGNGTRGFIIALSDGTVCFGVNASGGSRTICGTTDIRGDGPTYVAAQRNGTTGQVDLYVGATREDTSSGPTGAGE